MQNIREHIAGRHDEEVDPLVDWIELAFARQRPDEQRSAELQGCLPGVEVRKQQSFCGPQMAVIPKCEDSAELREDLRACEVYNPACFGVISDESVRM